MIVRVRSVLVTDMGTHLEYVGPAMTREEADGYIDQLRDTGVVASVVRAETRPISVREIVPDFDAIT